MARLFDFGRRVSSGLAIQELLLLRESRITPKAALGGSGCITCISDIMHSKVSKTKREVLSSLIGN